jgi:molybdopterin synthase sulfur carrier subunit
MKFQVRYFAALREALGNGETVELEPGATVAQLRDALLGRSALHADVLARSRAVRCALDLAMCGESRAITEGAEVAFFPPVTGG